jgi:hypothetical protein
MWMSNSCRKDELSGPLGIEAHDFLSNDKYTKLNIEIVFVKGYKPTDNTVSALQNFLDERVNKSSGISVFYKEISSPGKSYLTIDDIQKIEKKERDHYSKGSTLCAFLLFTDVPYTDPKVLGVAYGSTSIAVFESTIDNYSGGIAQPSRYVLESTVGEHEFGHLLGLVDFGTKMVTDHRDYSNGNHCSNQNCLMYYATETTDILGNLTGGNIPSLDQNCLDDLKSNGGK